MSRVAGKVVLVSGGTPDLSAYGASKGAMRQFTKTP
jgi:hypothetical protein